MDSSEGIDLAVDCFERICYEGSHLREDVTIDTDVFWGVCEVYVSLKISKWKFVTILKFTKIIWMFLDGIVCEVNEDICRLSWIFLTAHSQIPIFIEISFLNTIDTREQSITSDIKLSPVNQQRSIDVSLDDKSPFLFILNLIFHINVGFLISCSSNNNSSNFLHGMTYNDSIASVCVFTRFDDVHVLWCERFFSWFTFLTLIESLCESSNSSFLYAFVFLSLSWLRNMLVVLDLFLHSVEILCKLFEFRIVDSMINVKCNRKGVPRVLTFGLVIFRDVPKESLLVW